MAGTLPHQTPCPSAPRRSAPPSRWAASLRWWSRPWCLPARCEGLHEHLTFSSSSRKSLSEQPLAASGLRPRCVALAAWMGILMALPRAIRTLLGAVRVVKGFPWWLLSPPTQQKNARMPRFWKRNLHVACTRAGRTLLLCACPQMCAYLHESAVDSCCAAALCFHWLFFQPQSVLATRLSSVFGISHFLLLHTTAFGLCCAKWHRTFVLPEGWVLTVRCLRQDARAECRRGWDRILRFSGTARRPVGLM